MKLALSANVSGRIQRMAQKIKDSVKRIATTTAIAVTTPSSKDTRASLVTVYPSTVTLGCRIPATGLAGSLRADRPSSASPGEADLIGEIALLRVQVARLAERLDRTET
jgi:hypothetical protein